ncbi:MAG: ABC transporter permease [Chitinophagaceae bacterium]|nr:ABC transporter permease [Chitinophagaceae bacterium]MCW5904140.1 ABC transporter permease [Chitinophagaceae bacterium]
MLSLIKVEWLKLRKYKAFWWMLAIAIITYPSINIFFRGIYGTVTDRKGVEGEVFKGLIGNPFAFPEVWHSVAYFSSWLLVVPSLLIIMIITNEYTYKTNKQNIIDGWSRSEFILSKLYDVLVISTIISIVYIIITVVFGIRYSSEFQITRWDEQIKYVFLFFLQTFAQLTIAFFVGFILKRSFIALGVFIFYLIVVEPILGSIFKYYFKLPALANFLPLEISDKLIPPAAFLGKFNKEAYEQSLADINMHILYTCLLTAAVWFLCIRIYKKRDL